MKLIKNPKLVKIEWIDAVSNSSWFTTEQVDAWIKDYSGVNCENIGYLIYQDKHNYVVAGRTSRNNDEEIQYGLIQKIPKTWCKIYPLRNLPS